MFRWRKRENMKRCRNVDTKDSLFHEKNNGIFKKEINNMNITETKILTKIKTKKKNVNKIEIVIIKSKEWFCRRKFSFQKLSILSCENKNDNKFIEKSVENEIKFDFIELKLVPKSPRIKINFYNLMCSKQGDNHSIYYFRICTESFSISITNAEKFNKCLDYLWVISPIASIL